jgi:aryl-alcohol dehydrogenase-like predicted oxidoreductase
MNYRTLGKTGWNVSEISLGTWQIGGRWGEPFNEKNAEEVVHAAIDAGINFIDTADVYGDRNSERVVARVVKQRREKVWIATKCGRRLSPHTAEAYTPAALRRFVEDSLQNTGLETLDLIQLHCPPTPVYYRPEVFELFDTLRTEGKIRFLGVSVEKVEEAIKAIDYPNVATVQIIFNMFRQRPKDLFFHLAAKKNIGIIVRVPLASGLLTGKFSKETRFNPEDHRAANRNGELFDKGETFSGVPYEIGLLAVEELKQKLTNPNRSLALTALRWILDFKEIGCIIPGASRKDQILQNIKASDLPPLSPEEHRIAEEIYTKRIRPYVHYLW